MIQIDMEMPKNCQHCKYYRLYEGYVWCTLLNAYKCDRNCPLKEVNECKSEDCISREDAKALFKDDVAAINELNNLSSVYPKSDKQEKRQKVRDKMIVIKTMTNLPEHCYDCPCHGGESDYCQADEEHRYSDWRPFWCPLASVEVNDGQHIDFEPQESEGNK